MAALSGGSSDGMAFEVSSENGPTPVVRVRGELDIANVEELDRALAPVIASNPERLIVDVAGLRFADSSAIALWVKWATAVGSIELRDPSPLLRRVIRSMGLEQKFQLRT